MVIAIFSPAGFLVFRHLYDTAKLLITDLFLSIDSIHLHKCLIPNTFFLYTKQFVIYIICLWIIHYFNLLLSEGESVKIHFKRQFLIAETLSKDLKARRHYFQKWGYYKSSSIQEIALAITQIEWVFQRRTNLIHRFLAGHHAARARKRCSIAKKKLAIFPFKKFC